MSSRDRTCRPPSSGTENDTPPETSCSQVSTASVRTPKTPSISQSLGEFTFASPIPSPSRVYEDPSGRYTDSREPIRKDEDLETKKVCESCNHIV